jgi:hypothetical protein
MGILSAAAKAALKKKPTQFRFKKKYNTDVGKPNPEEDKVRSVAQRKVRGTSGKAADAGPDPVVVGRSSMPSMKDAVSGGARARAKAVAKFEMVSKRGSSATIRQEAKDKLKRLNKLSAEQESSRLRKSAVSSGGAKKLAKGEYVHKETGEVIKVTGKELSPVKLKGKLDDYFLNPTKNQLEQMQKSLAAKGKLGASKKFSKRLSILGRRSVEKPKKK